MYQKPATFADIQDSKLEESEYNCEQSEKCRNKAATEERSIALLRHAASVTQGFF